MASDRRAAERALIACRGNNEDSTSGTLIEQLFQHLFSLHGWVCKSKAQIDERTPAPRRSCIATASSPGVALGITKMVTDEIRMVSQYRAIDEPDPYVWTPARALHER